MLPDDAAGAGFGGQVKRDLAVEPGTLDQARSLVFLMAERAVHHVADAVDEPRLEAAAARKLEFDGFLGDELRLRCHDGAPGGGLGQFVLGAGALCFVFDAGSAASVPQSA